MNKLWRDIQLLLGICAFMALVHVVNVYSNGWLMQFALVPRRIESLPGIVITPFLHANVIHLISNMMGLLIFGSLCLIRSRRFFIRSSVYIVLVGGFLVWLFGRNSYHIGTSGWIFGLWSLCIAMAWVEKSFFNILIAVFVVLFYGGMIYGVLSSDLRISYESHLFGAMAGVLCAFNLHAKRRRQRSAI